MIHSDNEETNYYRKFCNFMKDAMLPQEGASDLIFAPTTRALKFYRSYFRQQLTDVLFVGVDDPVDSESIIKLFKGKKSENVGEFEATAFDQFKQAQDTSLEDLIGQLKQIKRESVIKTGQEVQVLFSDVREAPAHF